MRQLLLDLTTSLDGFIAALPVMCSVVSSMADTRFHSPSSVRTLALPKTTALRNCVVRVLCTTSSAAMTQNEAFSLRAMASILWPAWVRAAAFDAHMLADAVASELRQVC
jgi:hypothetical protein